MKACATYTIMDGLHIREAIKSDCEEIVDMIKVFRSAAKISNNLTF